MGHFVVPAEGKPKYDVRVEASGSTKWQLQALPLPVATPRVTHLGSPKRCVELYMIGPALGDYEDNCVYFGYPVGMEQEHN